MKKINLSKAIFGLLVIGALSFVFGPNIYAQFARQDGPSGWGYGNGYGYGYGNGVYDGSYRVNGATPLNQYGYGYGYGNRIVQLTISNPTLTLSKVYDGNTTATVTAGTLSGVISGENVTVTAAATYNSTAVGTGKTITVVYTLSGTNAANYTKPVNYVVTNGVITSTSNGGGSGVSTSYCTAVTYSDFGACTNGFQFRSVVSKSPTSCSLTTAQQIAAQQACTTITNANGEVITIPTSEEPSLVASVTALEKSLMKKINSALTNRLKGRILLQIQEKGQAWYVNPLDGSKYYLGRAADAFSIMRAFGLGMSNKTYNSFVAAGNKAPARLAGRILINVDDSGKAYYVNPLDLKLNYLGKPADAYSIMRTLGLGITNDNIRQIKVGEIK